MLLLKPNVASIVIAASLVFIILAAAMKASQVCTQLAMPTVLLTSKRKDQEDGSELEIYYYSITRNI